MSLLRKSEKEILEKAQKEQEKATAKVREIKKLEDDRQAKINAMKKDYERKLFDYKWRCGSFAVNEEPFMRLSLFFGWYAHKMKDMSRAELFNVIKQCHLEEFREFINKMGQPAEQPPKEPDYNVIGEE